MSLEDFITKTNVNPQKIFGITQDKETFFEADLDEEWTVEDSKLRTKCKWSPFADWRLYGKPKRVVIRGVEVIRSGKLLDERQFGKNVLSK
jgi:dihydroorotase